MKKHSGEFLYLSFAVTRLKIKLNHIEIAQNTLPSAREHPEGVSKQVKHVFRKKSRFFYKLILIMKLSNYVLWYIDV